MTGDYDDLAGMSSVIRHQRESWDRLARVWPDIAHQLAVVNDSVDDAIISIGANDWSPDDQFQHFTGLRTQVDNLGFGLNALATDWEDQW